MCIIYIGLHIFFISNENVSMEKINNLKSKSLNGKNKEFQCHPLKF